MKTDYHIKFDSAAAAICKKSSVANPSSAFFIPNLLSKDF